MSEQSQDWTPGPLTLSFMQVAFIKPLLCGRPCALQGVHWLVEKIKIRHKTADMEAGTGQECMAELK